MPRTVARCRAEIHGAALEGGHILARQVGDLDAAVELHRTHRRDDDCRRGAQPRRAAQDVDELLRAEVGAEPGLGDHVVGQVQGGAGREVRIAPVGDIGERAAVDEGGRVLERLHEVRRQCVAQHGGHRAVRSEIPRVHGPAIAGVADHDVAEPLLEVAQVGGEAEDRHHLRGHHDVEAGLTRVSVARAAEADDDVAESPIADVEHAAPCDPADVDPECVAVVDVVVDHRREQIGRHGDRREVTREMKVDVLHRHDLRVPSARGAALHAEHRSERRLPQTDHGAFADTCERVAEPDRGRRLALAGWRRRDGGDEHQLALRSLPYRGEVVQRHLGLVPAVRFQALLGDAEAIGHGGDRKHARALRDLDVAQAHRRTLPGPHGCRALGYGTVVGPRPPA